MKVLSKGSRHLEPFELSCLGSQFFPLLVVNLYITGSKDIPTALLKFCAEGLFKPIS